MWTVVYLARSKDIADKLLEALEHDGLLAKIRPVSKGVDSDYEILVPESEINEAHAVIIDLGF